MFKPIQDALEHWQEVEVTCGACAAKFTRMAFVDQNGVPRRAPTDEQCQDCLADKQARWEAQEREMLASAAKERQRRWREQRLAESQLPTMLQAARLDSLPSGLRSRIEAWIAGDVRGLLLHGGVGVGKTYAAAAGCLGRVERTGVVWIAVATLMTRLKLGFGDADKQRAQELVAGCTHAILDDLDKINPTEFGREVIYTLIDNRVSEGASLLVTTNLPPGQLSRRLGDPVVSRLVGYCEVVEVVGRDRRIGTRSVNS